MLSLKVTMRKYAVCLVTDDKYLLPTTVAAIQARRAAPASDIDVFVLAMDLPEQRIATYGPICQEAGVQLTEVSRKIFGGNKENAFIDAFFAGSPFTFGALGRLFLDQVLPAEYTELLYIDGDVQIEHPLAPLIRFDVPEGKFLAAPDPKVFWIEDMGVAADRERQYMRGLGLGNRHYRHYFNSGVLRISRAGWRNIGLAAWEFLQKHEELCVCHDQSALNAVAAEARLPLSLKWNFPVYFRQYGLDKDISPHITHFMSRPKPWNGVFPPWTNREHQVYRDFVSRHPELTGDADRFTGARAAKYHVQQRLKSLDERLHPERRRRVRDRVLAYERTAVV